MLRRFMLGAQQGINANANDFDGSSNYLTRGADLTGVSDGPLGAMSLWFRLDGGDGSQLRLWTNDQNDGYCTAYRGTDNKLRVDLYDSTAALNLKFGSTGTYLAGATWHHVCASWNTNFSAGNKLYKMIVDGVDVTATVADASNAFDIAYVSATTNFGMYGGTTGNNKFNGCIAETWFAPGQYIDFSVAANVQKFRTVSGRPANLGPAGALPTGVAPAVYLPSATSSMGTNAGTGGNFSINGTLNACSSTP